jgi:hypothetical protein
MTVDADVAPLMNGQLAALLPDKYPGMGYNHTQSYMESRQFVRNAAQVGFGIGRAFH